VNVDAYVPADYVPYEQAKVDVHRRVAASRDVADLAQLRDELEDRFGPVPEPLENLIALQQARIKLGRAGARAVSFRGETLAATPMELTPEQADELRERVPGARYEPGRSQVSVRVPRDAEGRFRIVVAAADALLAVTAPSYEAAAA
jgi:transcription-repair coupling factor (superfamily II helicase)